jgi:hypothetical protein
MAATIITQEDLIQFKADLFEELKKYFSKKDENAANTKWLKSHQVQRLLSISPGTLQNLRVNGTIPYTKVGGVIFYAQEDINTIMQFNKRNIKSTNGKLF